MGETVKINTKSWPTYRSTYTVKAKLIADEFENVKPGDSVTISIDDKRTPVRGEDYLVETPEGRIEHWEKARLERELELAPAQVREISVERES